MNLLKRFRRSQVNREVVKSLMQKTEKEINNIHPINIILAGKTGSGKSTLINALFRENLAETGVGLPVTQYVEKITKEGVPLALYDTQGLELSPEAQHAALLSLSNLIKEEKAKGSRAEIDLAYYCINQTMARIEPFEMELIEAIAEYIPVVLVLTQAIGHNKEFVQYLEQLNLPIKAIVPVLAKPYRLEKQTEIPAHGLQNLINQTLSIVPSEVHKAFINAQQIDIERKVKDARSWAHTYITTAFGIGFTPVPIADAALLVPMQITMLAHITAIFGLSLDKAQIVSLIAGLGGTGGATYFGKFFVSSAFKLIPSIGSVAGGVLSGTTAGMLTIALAYSYIEVLKQIAAAELSGTELKLFQLQTLMQQNFSRQLKLVFNDIPDEVKKIIPSDWLNGFFK